jgi:hypothetical protein
MSSGSIIGGITFALGKLALLIILLIAWGMAWGEDKLLFIIMTIAMVAGGYVGYRLVMRDLREGRV